MHLNVRKIVPSLLVLAGTIQSVYAFSPTPVAIDPPPHPVSVQERANHSINRWIGQSSQMLSFMRREGDYAKINNVSCSIRVRGDYLFDCIKVVRSSKSARIDRLAIKLLTLKKPLSRVPSVRGKTFQVDFNEPNALPNNNGDDVKISLTSKQYSLSLSIAMQPGCQPFADH